MPVLQTDIDAHILQMVEDVRVNARRRLFGKGCPVNTTALVKHLSIRAMETELGGGASFTDTELAYVKQNKAKEYGCDC